MAVDRGGLQYTITVINAFSGPLRQFRTEIVQARRSFISFRNSVRGLRADARAASVAIRSVTAASRRLSAANRAGINSSQARVAALRNQVQALQQSSAAERTATTARQAGLTSIRAQNTALRAQESTLTRVAAAQRRLGASGGIAARGVDQASRAAVRGQAAFGGLLLTVRRLVTTLLFFEGARFIVDGIRSLVGGTIEFASALEQATLGTATLLTALGRIESASGTTLQGVEALTAAERISEEQLRQLRVEALQTAATFDQLAQTFQVAIAPGVTGGLNLDEIRRVTVQISQAASAIGLAQNELNEEVRSLLQGTISQRFTRIATALFIKPADIRNAREQGRLFEFLQERLEAFSTAGGRSLLTFQARVTNAVDALFQLSSTGAADFFANLSDTLADATESAINLNTETRRIELNPEVIEVFRILFDALSRSVDQARTLASSLDFEDLRSAASAIATTIDLITSVFAGAFDGAIQGAGDLVFIFRTILATVQNITGLDLLDPQTIATAQQFLATFVRVFVVFKGIQLTTFAITTNLGLIVGLGLVIAAALDNASGSGQQLLDSLTGIRDVDFGTGFGALAAEAKAAIDTVLSNFRAFGELLEALFITVGRQIGLALERDLIRSLEPVLTAVRALLEGLAQTPLVDPGTAASLQATAAALETLTTSAQEREAIEKRISAELKQRAADILIADERRVAAIQSVLAAELEANNARAAGGEAGLGEAASEGVFANLKNSAIEAAEFIKQTFVDLGLTIPESLQQGLKELEKSFTVDMPRFVASGAEKTERRFTEKFFDRIRENLKEFESSGGAFNEFFSFLENSVRRLTDLIADLIVDAFDPTTDISARERFLTFLRELAREAIRILLRIALAKAAATIFGPKGEEAARAARGGQVSGLASGGSLSSLREFDNKARNALFNFNVGFASGGKIGTSPGIAPTAAVRRMRPSGLHPTDTVPIWAGRKEWVIRAKSSEMYGGRVMSAINRGLIDPFALRALAGSKPSSVRRRARGAGSGFQTGGQVSSARAVATTSVSPQPTVVGAVVVPDERNMERMLNGGSQAMLEWISNNRPAVKGLLS